MTTANLALQDLDPVIQYTSTGESQFAFPFPVLNSNELKVSIDQVPQVLGVDYTIAGVGSASGGTITFTDPTTPGERVTLWLDIPLDRLTGFAAGVSTLLPGDLNTEFVRRVRVDQVLRRDIGRALRLAIDDPQSGQDMIVPTRDDRAGRFLAFDAAGRPVAAEGTGADSGLRADLAAPSGAGLVGLPQGGSIPDAIRWVTPEIFGAIGDGVTDDTLAIQQCFAADNVAVHFAPGATYRITASIPVTGRRNITVTGNRARLYTNTTRFTCFRLEESDHISFNRLRWEIATEATEAPTGIMFLLRGADYFHAYQCETENAPLFRSEKPDVRLANIRPAIVHCISDGGPSPADGNFATDNKSGTGVALGACIAPVLAYSEIRNSQLDAVKLTHEAGAGVSQDNALILHNWLHDAGEEGIDVFSKGRRTLIAHNRIERTLGVGVMVKNEPTDGPLPSSAEVYAAQVIYNSILDCTQAYLLQRVFGGVNFAHNNIERCGVNPFTAATQTSTGIIRGEGDFIHEGNNYIDNKSTGQVVRVAMRDGQHTRLRMINDRFRENASPLNMVAFDAGLTTATIDFVCTGHDMRLEGTTRGISIRTFGDSFVKIANGYVEGGAININVQGASLSDTYLAKDNESVGVAAPGVSDNSGGGLRLIQDGNSWNPRVTHGTAAPSTGAWLRGDQVINTQPSAAGTPGWVCTASGTPGTWKARAALEA